MAARRKTIAVRKALVPAKSHGGRVAVKAASYDAAGSGRRSKGWAASSLGPNSILTMDAEVLRRRSHDLLRQNPWAFSGIESFVANCVGTGIKPQSRASDIPFRKVIHQLWQDWTDDADSDNQTDLYGLQAMVCRSLIEGGECFVRFRERRPEDGLTVPLQLQILEAEHVPMDKNEILPNGNTIKCGIEFDRIGRRVAYWVYRQHPGESLAYFVNQAVINPLDLVRIPAESMMHIYKPLRPGQLRGEPWMARVLIRLHELDKCDDAKLAKQLTAALFTGFITVTGTEQPGQFGEGEPDDDGVSIAGLSPGVMQLLQPGQGVEFTDPPETGDDSGTFTKHQLRGISAGMSTPYSHMTGDVSDANYSSIRTAIIEFRRRCEMFLDNCLVFKFCRPVYQRWMTTAVLAGRLDPRLYLRDERDAVRAVWIGNGWQWVDPLKEVEAARIAVRSGFKSRSMVIAEMGEDAELVDETIAADNQRADSLGLVFDTDPRKVQSSGAVHHMATNQEVGQHA